MIAPDRAAFASAMAEVNAASARVALSMPALNAAAINASPQIATLLARKTRGKVKLVPDRIESIVRPDFRADAGWNDPTKLDPTMLVRRGAATGRPAGPFTPPTASPFDILAGFTPDPAFALGPPSPMWNVERIGGPAAWASNAGDDDVFVAVADTGLDYTHTEIADKVFPAVIDISATEGAGLEICKDIFQLPEGNPMDDADLAALAGVPANLDFNGHGSWIGGNIAAEVDGNALNGVAPGVSLVSLKISQWCGSAFDSEILYAFMWAADHGVDIVSISFGGYLDKTDPFQAPIWGLYVAAVKYAKAAGTTIVAAAGNEHAKIASSGQVVSHGILSAPPGGDDLFGLYETPGGVPGVVDVSATGNVVNAPSGSCPAGSTGSPTDFEAFCKPTTDVHQPLGVGMQNQLAYYSNYGSRIDVAGPGGARKFNLPYWDRGGTEGWPFAGEDSYLSDNSPGGGASAGDGFNVWEDFSMTSNYAVEIPCVIFDGTSADPDPDGYYGVPMQTGFDDDQCYSSIQGTSMATPHASAVLALIASAFPELRFDVKALIKRLKETATPFKTLVNTTPPVSTKDFSDTDLTAETCDFGFCHLGGGAIPAKQAYGAGLVNAANAVAGGLSGP